MHPLVKILWFLLLLSLVQLIKTPYLWVLCGTVCVLAVFYSKQYFMRIIKRMKWFFISMLIIYAFITPGELLPQFPIQIAPTYEGLNLGLVQISKLLMTLALLSILFSSTTKEAMMYGLYLLLKPLNTIGIQSERFILRLILTLDYVEKFSSQKQSFNLSQLDQLLLDNETNMQESGVVELVPISFKTFDKYLLAIFVVSLIGMLWYSAQ